MTVSDFGVLLGNPFPPKKHRAGTSSRRTPTTPPCTSTYPDARSLQLGHHTLSHLHSKSPARCKHSLRTDSDTIH
eukprot:2271852-Amphidinium_carterae.1